MKRLIIHIQGKVQGVYFRASTKQKADELGIKGYVMNQSDGSVKIEAEGTDSELEKFIEWCGRGPSRAAVTSVNFSEGSWVGHLDFTIRR